MKYLLIPLLFLGCATHSPPDYGTYIVCVNFTDKVAYDEIVYKEDLTKMLRESLSYYDECRVVLN
jgi:hypothetical protein